MHKVVVEALKDRRMQYLLAVAVVLATAVIRWPIQAAGLTAGSPFLLFSVAILVSAWFGGWGPGLLATLLSGLIADVLFMRPRFTLSLGSEQDVAALLFVGQGVLITWLGASRLKAHRHVQNLLQELEHRVEERTAELRVANALLSHQAEERERDRLSLQQMNVRLGQSNRELQDFASVASHDLQEPLRKIRAFGDRLAQRAGPQLSHEDRDYLDRMLRAAERMQVLISDLLAFSRVTSKAQPFVRVDLGEIVAGVLSDLEARIEAAGARVQVGKLPMIDADPLQMRQLFQNLVSNALKFGREGVPSHVRIEAEPAPPRALGEHVDEAVLLHVRDNGIGFEEKYVDRIFNVFQRLHGRGDYEGTGIGLAVCRKIARRHGGEISARSAPGAGATFTVTLPVYQPEGATQREATGVFPSQT